MGLDVRASCSTTSSAVQANAGTSRPALAVETSPPSIKVQLGHFLLFRLRDGGHVAFKLTEHTRPNQKGDDMLGARYVGYVFPKDGGKPSECSGEVYMPDGAGRSEHQDIICGDLRLKWYAGDWVYFYNQAAVAMSDYQEIGEVKFDSPPLKWAVNPLSLANRPLADLSATNLVHLYEAQNELGDLKGESRAAEELWRKAPGSTEAVACMARSLLNTCHEPKDAGRIVDFADLCLTNGYGDRPQVLLCKAEGLARLDSAPDPSRRLEIRRLIVSAHSITNSLSSVYFNRYRAASKIFTEAEQKEIRSEVSEYWRKIRTLGRYFAWKDDPIPEEVKALARTLSQSFTRRDFPALTNLFLPLDHDDSGRKRAVYIIEIQDMWNSAAKGQVTALVGYTPLCFDPTNQTLLVERLYEGRTTPIEFRESEFDLRRTAQGWRIAAVRDLHPGEVQKPGEARR